MNRRLRRDFLLADLAAVEEMLDTMSPEDLLGRLSFQSRKEEIETELRRTEERPENHAVIALTFGGDPVLGSRGIEAKFGSQAVVQYQELVSKISIGRLNASGPIPNVKATQLHITGVLHGSFGFQLEELQEGITEPLLNTSLKSASEEAMRVTMAAADDDDEIFFDAIAGLDSRTVKSLKEFLETLKNGKATMRLATGEEVFEFKEDDITRAFERVSSTKIEENTSDFEGELQGILPTKRLYEFKRGDTGEILSGKFVKELEESDLIRFNKTWLGKTCLGKFRVTEIARAAKTTTRYTLVNIEKSPSG